MKFLLRPFRGKKGGLFGSAECQEVKHQEQVLLKLRKVLERKEFLLRKKEQELQSRENQLSTQEDKLTYEEKDFSATRKKFSVHKAKKEKHALAWEIAHLTKQRDKLHASVEQSSESLKQVHTDLRKGQWAFDRRERQLIKQEETIKSLTARLAKQQKEIEKHSRELEKQEGALDAEQNKLRKEKRVFARDASHRKQKKLVREIRRLQHSKDKLVSSVKEQTKTLSVLDKEVRVQRKSLQKQGQDLERGTVDLSAHEKEFKHKQTLFARLKIVLAKKEELLYKRESEMRSREKTIDAQRRQLETDKKVLRSVRNQKRVSLAKEIAKLNQQRTDLYHDIQDGKSTLRRFDSDISHRQSALKKHESTLFRRMKDLKVIQKELYDKETLLTKKEKLLQKEEDSLIKREQGTFDKEKGITQKYKAVEKKLQVIVKRESKFQADYTLLTDLRKEVHLDREELKKYPEKIQKLHELKKVLRQQKEELEKKVIAFEREQEEVVLKTKLHTLKKEVESKHAILKKLQKELEMKEGKIEADLEEVKLKERDIVQEKVAWLDKQSHIKDALQDLERIKSIIEEEFKVAHVQMETLHEEWAQKASLLREHKVFIKSETDRLSKLKLDDLSLLKDKESEIQRLVNRIQKDEKEVLQMEKTVAERMDKLEHEQTLHDAKELFLQNMEGRLNRGLTELQDNQRLLEKNRLEVEKTHSVLQSKLDKVNKVKELRESLPALQERQHQLQGLISRAEARLMGLGLEPLVQREQLADLRGDIASKQQELDLKRQLLDRERGELALEKDLFRRSEVKALTKYLSQELEKEMGHELPVSTKYPEIYGLLEEAKAAVNDGRLNDAIRLVVRVDMLSERIRDISEKRSVSYDVMEIKTNIKLATLA